MKKLSVIRYALSLLLFTTGALEAHAQSLKGQWVSSSQDGQVVLNIVSDSELIFDGARYNYSVQQSNLMVNVDGYMIGYPYWFEGSTLNIYFPEGYTLQFKKGAAQAANRNNPKTSGGSARSGGKYLQGRLCYYASSSSYSTYSSYSRTNSYYFDGNGNFEYYQEQAYSGSTGYSYSSDNSGAQRGTYRISGNQVIVRFNDGSTYSYNIHYTQNNGRITELKSGDEYYASGLCE